MSPLSFGIGKLGKNPPIDGLPLSYGRYFVFQYYFTDGSDLDQRTSIITPSISGSVGFGSSTSIEPYLYWAGDNTGSGLESVYFDKVEILNNYGGSVIEIDCQSWWYGAQGINPVNIIVSTYNGGSMIVDNFQWTNPTATHSFVGFTSSPGKIISTLYADPGGPERVAKFTFNFLSNTFSVVTT